MAVEERNGRYRGVYRLPGSRTRLYTDTYSSYYEAHDAVLEAKKNTPEPAVAWTARGATVAEHAHDWLRRRTCGPTTLSWYRTQVVCGIDDYDLGDTLIESADYRTVQAWLVAQIQRGTGKPAINARLKVLRMIMQDAVRAKLIDDDPTEGVKRFKHQPREGRYFTDEEVGGVLDAAASEDRTLRLLILVCVDAGLRWEEAAALCVDAVGMEFITVKRSTDRRGHVIDDTKNHKDRRVPIGDRLAAELAKAVKPARLARGPKGLLVCQDGRPVDYFHYHRELLLPAFAAAGITGGGLGWHDLRHTFGSKCAERGVPTSVIQRWMGHSDPKITDRYLHAGTAVTELDMLRRALR
jgi:integrase